ASVAIENARLFSQTQQRVNELTTVLESSAVISSTLEIGSVLELIGRRLLDALNVAYCSIGAWDRKTNELAILNRVTNSYWKPGSGPQRSAALNVFLSAALGDSVSLTFTRGDANLDEGIRNYMQALDSQSLLIVPLRLDQHTVGLIELSSTKVEVAYNGDTARRVGEALTRWRDQLRKRGSTDWDSRDNLTDLYQRVARAADASWCIISLLDPSSGQLRPVREIGFAVWDEHSPVRYDLQQYPLMARTLSEGTTVAIRGEALEQDPAERTLLERAGASAGLLVPLLVRGEAIGLIRLLDVGHERTFDLSESSLVQGIANVVANAMENAQLYLSLERRANALQAAYDELRLSDKAKDSLIQNVSHELQTPLHKLVMELDLLVEEVYGPLNDEQKEAMQSAISRSTHLGDIVRDMVSVLDLDVEGLVLQESAIGEIVENAVRTALPKAHQVGLQLVTALPRELPPVRGDSARLGEVLNQLIDNAIKFSPRGERKADRIEVRVEESDGPMLRLCVQDFGIGIPDGEFDKIFHKGYQVDGSLTRRFGGTGLGLALARQIVEAHGGKIWVESTGSGGSQFLFTIPKFGVQF
ncbi:MAG TPA: ATP-binding protein, partial [Aggregatilineales bacterium]|nr:ATP-binding protein [Aggregatilineales bacterium]